MTRVCAPVGVKGRPARNAADRSAGAAQRPRPPLRVLRRRRVEHGHLQQQQLLEGQPLARLRRLREVCREVAGQDGLRPARVAPLGPAVSAGSGSTRCTGVGRRLVQQRADGAHAQVGGARVDGHQPQDVAALLRLAQDLVPLDQEEWTRLAAAPARPCSSTSGRSRNAGSR